MAFIRICQVSATLSPSKYNFSFSEKLLATSDFHTKHTVSVDCEARKWFNLDKMLRWFLFCYNSHYAKLPPLKLGYWYRTWLKLIAELHLLIKYCKDTALFALEAL